ncbi:hypothetical protein CFB44_34400 [Burkholderia sp. AU31280]|nr:hypothetical protein CFB44_34400 [Burkholderia sp. AU31280]RQV62414.1 hypothetical protein DF024_18325 [Burkholderia cenocepacia]
MQYHKYASQGSVSTGRPNQFPRPPGDIERHCPAVQHGDGDCRAVAEALLAARLERVSLDDMAHQAQPLPPGHGAHHHE